MTLSSVTTPAHTRPIDRRAVAKGVAWMAPAVTFAAAAPSLAASTAPPGAVPGINGWVRATPRSTGVACSYTLEVNSASTGATPDGAPFGLYLYGVKPQTIVANASLAYWIIGTQSATWNKYTDHSSCWSNPVRGAAVKKSDGLSYTPYTFTYTCPILPSNVSSDGRLYLGTFHVRASFTQPSTYCNDVTYWAQRSVTLDPDGAGAQPAQTLTFERRAGTRGAATSPTAASRRSSGGAEGDALV